MIIKTKNVYVIIIKIHPELRIKMFRVCNCLKLLKQVGIR